MNVLLSECHWALLSMLTGGLCVIRCCLGHYNIIGIAIMRCYEEIAAISE